MGIDANMSANVGEDPFSRLLAGLSPPAPPPRLPGKLTPTVLRKAIATRAALRKLGG